MPGVTGSDLKKRIQAILTGRVPGRLNSIKKAALAVAGIAALAGPVVTGVINAPAIRAQSTPAGTLKFEVASVKPCNTFSGSTREDWPSRELHTGCTTVQSLIERAYGLFANGRMNPLSSVTITGGPAWTNSGFYEIDAEAERPHNLATMNGPMLQSLLEDRFKLKIHRETRRVPVYALTVAKDRSKLQPFQGSCIAWDFDHPPSHPPEPALRCGTARLTSDGLDVQRATMADLCMFFLVTLDRPVIDKTGLTGKFNFHLKLPAEAIKDFGRRPRGLGVRPGSGPASPPNDPSLISAIKTAITKLGLNLEPTEGPGEFLVIDRVERPSEN